jgi:hypothetical protein
LKTGHTLVPPARTWYRSQRWRLSLLGAIILICLVAAPQVALATDTPVVCDSAAKYHCTSVSYTNHGSYVSVAGRYFQGARDGGADRWQRYWVQDWSQSSGDWYTTSTWGEGPWYTNVSMGSWYGVTGGTISQPALVKIRLRYQEGAIY